MKIHDWDLIVKSTIFKAESPEINSGKNIFLSSGFLSIIVRFKDDSWCQ